MENNESSQEDDRTVVSGRAYLINPQRKVRGSTSAISPHNLLECYVQTADGMLNRDIVMQWR